MKRFLVLIAVVVGAVAAAWVAAHFRTSHLHQADEEVSLRYAPAPGRIEFVSLEALDADPGLYNGKRVILAGIWKTGFEHSALHSSANTQSLWIWVDVDWNKVNEPMGNLASNNEKVDEKFDANGFISRHIIAEGTFFYKKDKGFGHFGVFNAFFQIDRLYSYEPITGKELKELAAESTPATTK